MSEKVIATTQRWSADEAALLARIARLIIGEDKAGVMPAVDDELLLPVILDRAREFDKPVSRGLVTLGELSKVHGSPIEMPDDGLASLMEAHRELRSLLRAMMQVVAQCYYEDERVLLALGLESRPPFPKGHEVEQGDFSLLDAVRRGPPRYRLADSS